MCPMCSSRLQSEGSSGREECLPFFEFQGREGKAWEGLPKVWSVGRPFLCQRKAFPTTTGGPDMTEIEGRNCQEGGRQERERQNRYRVQDNTLLVKTYTSPGMITTQLHPTYHSAHHPNKLGQNMRGAPSRGFGRVR